MIKTPHRFYRWPRWRRWLFIAGWVSVYILIIGLVIGLTLSGRVWGIFLFPFMFIPAQFIDTPFGYRQGQFLYFSQLLLVKRIENKQKLSYELHVGSLFDFWFVFRWRDAGEAARRKTVTECLIGLDRFIDYVKQNGQREVIITGSSYFFSERNATRLGFEAVELSVADRVFPILTIAVLITGHSFTQGHLAWPPIGRTLKVQATGADLIENQSHLKRLIARMERGRVG